MKKHLLLFLLLVISFSASAQFRVGTDAVYLKDGSVIRGTIRFAEPDSTLFIDTNYGCTFVYSKSEVERFELKEQKPFEREKGLKLQSSLAGGWYEPNMEIGITSDVTIGLMYQVCNWYAVGLDFSWFFLFCPGVITTPALQLDQRFYFMRKPVSPYLDLKFGSSFSFNMDGEYASGPTLYEEYYGYKDCGWTGELGVGVSLRNVDLTLCASVLPYKHIKLVESQQYSMAYVYSYKSGDRCMGFSIRIGYTFPIK